MWIEVYCQPEHRSNVGDFERGHSVERPRPRADCVARLLDKLITETLNATDASTCVRYLHA